MQKILYNGYQSSTTKTGFVDSEILSQDSVDQEFKARHYFRYMCSHREAFAAIRSTKVELLTENFQNITTVLLSKKIVLQKSLSHALVKEIMTLDAKGITQQVVYNEYRILNHHEVFEGCVKNASFFSCSKRWFDETFFSWAKNVESNILCQSDQPY